MFAGGKPEPKEIKVDIPPERFAAAHLTGTTCLGFYLVDPATDEVRVSALDFDDHDGNNPQAVSDARTVCLYLESLGITPLLERSQSGTGWHVWVAHEAPVSAKTARAFWRVIQQETQTRCEIYPKQDSVQALDKRLGNFLRYPLWNCSRFETPRGEALDALTTLRMVQRLPTHVLEKVAARDAARGLKDRANVYETEGMPSSVAQAINNDADGSLYRRWAGDASGMADGSRSALVMSIATELVRRYIPTPEIEAGLKYWCDTHDYEQTDRWIALTTLNAYKFADDPAKDHARGSTFRNLGHRVIDSFAQGDIVLVPSGIKALDDSIQGIGLGELGIVCARTNNGKSTVLIQWMDSAAELGFPCLFISLEMNARSTLKRSLLRMGIDPKRIRHMNVADVHAAWDEHQYSRVPTYFVDCEPELSEVLSTCKKYIKEQGVKFIGIDHAGLIEVNGRQLTDNTSSSLRKIRKQLAQEHDVSVLTLGQFNRQFERDGAGRLPVLADLAWGGENDADMIVAGRWLYREEPVEDNRNRYKFHVLKMRDRGFKQAEVDCLFIPEQQIFREVVDV